MLQATQNVSTDFTLTNQLTRALRILGSDRNDKEWTAAYDLTGDMVTALSRVEAVSAHAALARAAALIGDLDAFRHNHIRENLLSDCNFQQTWNRILRLAWQSVFFLEDEFCTTAAAHGLDHFAPMHLACKLFPGLDRPAEVEMAQAAE
jgi:hypothetical protein